MNLVTVLALRGANLRRPPAIRRGVRELEMTGRGQSASRCGPVHRQLAHTATFWSRAAPRMFNANTVAYFASSFGVLSLRVRDTFLTKAGRFFVVRSPSMIIEHDGPRRRAACEKGTDFPPRISVNLSYLLI